MSFLILSNKTLKADILEKMTAPTCVNKAYNDFTQNNIPDAWLHSALHCSVSASGEDIWGSGQQSASGRSDGDTGPAS